MKPQKKIPETDAIFEHVAQANRAADANPTVLRLSIDSKARVKIGNLSRGGQARTLEANQADDHDDHWDAVLVPFGILDVADSQLSISLINASALGMAVFSGPAVFSSIR